MTLYETLGLAPTATREQIRQAYRKLAQKHHPDRSTGDKAVFQAVQQAYDILMDPERRARYDQSGDVGGQEVSDDEKLTAAAQQALMSLLLQVMEATHNISAVDLLAKCLESVARAQSVAQTDLRKVEAGQEKARKAAQRFQEKEGKENRMSLLGQTLAGQYDKPIADIKAIIARNDRMKLILQEHTYRVDVPDAPESAKGFTFSDWTTLRIEGL
jgi:curved DNA-binding protein CbpA